MIDWRVRSRCAPITKKVNENDFKKQVNVVYILYRMELEIEGTHHHLHKRYSTTWPHFIHEPWFSTVPNPKIFLNQ